MKKLIILLLVCFMASSVGCLFDECKDTEQPEIRFDFIVYGYVVVKSLETGEVATSEWANHTINCVVTKYYCDGTAKGPFDEQFVTDASGSLIKQGIGFWSYRMDNQEDYMRVVFFYEGSELGFYHSYYDELSKYDGRAANLQFKIDIEWDFINNKLFHSKVTLL